MSRVLTYPAIALSGARSGITHAAQPGSMVEADGWATAYCGRMVSVDHGIDGSPVAATTRGDEDGPMPNCLGCAAGVERYEADNA